MFLRPLVGDCCLNNLKSFLLDNREFLICECIQVLAAKDCKLKINHALVILKVRGARSGAFEDFYCLNPNTSILLAKSYSPLSIDGLLNIHYLYLRIKLMSKVIFSIQYPHQLFRINISLSLVGYYHLNQCYKIHQL